MARDSFGEAVTRELEKQAKAPMGNKLKGKSRPKTRKKAGDRRGKTELHPDMESHKFKPGQSGNPNGRPKKLPITDAIRKLIDSPAPKKILNKYVEGHGENLTYGDVLGISILERAEAGDNRMVEVILDRIEGKVVQTVAGPGGGAIPIEMSAPEENVKRIAELIAKAGISMNGGGSDGNRDGKSRKS